MASPDADAEIYDVLSTLLLSGRLPGGMRLAEVDLADAFGVTRERVRKVVLRLGAERLIEIVPNRGAFVASPSLADARAIYDGRRVLEGGMLLALAGTISDEQLTELETHLKDEHNAAHHGDRSRMVHLSAAFHFKLAEMTGNPFIIGYVRELVSRTSMLVALFEESTSTCALDEHRRIFDALKQRDGKLAAEASTIHLSLIETRLKVTKPKSIPPPDVAKLVKSAIAERARDLRSSKSGARPKRSRVGGNARSTKS
jgi:DNA-binding GntR family transcriptional regulator